MLSVSCCFGNSIAAMLVMLVPFDLLKGDIGIESPPHHIGTLTYQIKCGFDVAPTSSYQTIHWVRSNKHQEVNKQHFTMHFAMLDSIEATWNTHTA